jgi:hypothetical protein
VRQIQRVALGASCLAAHTKPNQTRSTRQTRTLSDMQLKPYLPSTLARSMTSNYTCTLVPERASPHAAPLKSFLLLHAVGKQTHGAHRRSSLTAAVRVHLCTQAPMLMPMPMLCPVIAPLVYSST